MQRIKNLFLTAVLFLFVVLLVVAANVDVQTPQESTSEPFLATSVSEKETQGATTSESFLTTEPQQTTTEKQELTTEPPVSVNMSWGDATTVKADELPVVYMTKKIDAQSLVAIYKALNVSFAYKKAAVKISTGETGSNYLPATLIKDLVQLVNGTIVECNTGYGGERASTAMHYQLAKDHGYTDIADVVIMDEKDTLEIPVNGGTHLKTNLVGARFSEFDYFVILSHFKGHIMAGYGGALKNMSIGIASSVGKRLIHTAGTSRDTIDYENVDAFLESMAEAAKSVSDALDGKIVYINVMNNLSVDCDCDSQPAAPTMADIGILASTDPVALDRACLDLVYAAPDGKDLIERVESLNGAHILTHAEKIGFGSQEYKLVTIDD